MNIGSHAVSGSIADESHIADLLADRKLNRAEKVERICDMISEAERAGESNVRLSGDFIEVVHMLWRMRGHCGQQAWRAMERFIAENTAGESGAAADAIIDRWCSEWLRHADNE